MRIPRVDLAGVFFDRGGSPTEPGSRLLRAVAALVDRTGGINGDYLPLEPKTVAQLQAITPTGPALGYCANEVGGETLVYYAPTAAVWRRSRDDVTISA